MLKNKKANVTLLVVFFMLSTIVLIVASILAPLGLRFSAEFYRAGELILNNSVDTINSINSTAARTSIKNSLDEARLATQDNIDILGSLYQYGWVLVIIIVGFVMFLASRFLVENVSFGGGFV